MDRWLGTAIAVFGIVACVFIEYVLSACRPYTEDEKECKKCSRYDVILLVQAILLLLSVVLLIYIWSDLFPWLRPRIIAPGPIPWHHGLIS